MQNAENKRKISKKKSFGILIVALICVITLIIVLHYALPALTPPPKPEHLLPQERWRISDVYFDEGKEWTYVTITYLGENKATRVQVSTNSIAWESRWETSYWDDVQFFDDFRKGGTETVHMLGWTFDLNIAWYSPTEEGRLMVKFNPLDRNEHLLWRD